MNKTLNQIPIINFINRSEKDKSYIQEIARDLKISKNSLSAIIGQDELKEILKNTSPENFSPQSPSYMINLHTHSIFSDGSATINEILDEAQFRAEKSGLNFLIGFTDHDCLDGAQYLLKTLIKQPEKYNKIRIMVGAEPCFKYENSEIFKKPIPFDAIMYCINPFEKNIIELFDKYTNKNRDYSKLIMHKVNQKWNVNANYEDSCKFHCLLKTGGSSGFFKFTRKYVENLLDKNEICYSPIEILEIFKPFYANQNGRVTLATMDIKEAVKRLDKSFGQIGIAHPALLELNPKFEEGWDFTSCDNFNDRITYDKALEIFIKTCGLEIVELNYQYQIDGYLKKYPEIPHLIEIVNKICKNISIIPSGGTDSHGNSKNSILNGRY